jgi:hypothetical protein
LLIGAKHLFFAAMVAIASAAGVKDEQWDLPSRGALMKPLSCCTYYSDRGEDHRGDDDHGDGSGRAST